MNLAPMRYKDYVWPHNPETYTISFKRQVAVAKVPFGRYGMQDLGMSYRVMEGEAFLRGRVPTTSSKSWHRSSIRAGRGC